MKKNSFIDYLDQFNILSPNHAKIYDEYTIDDRFKQYDFTIETKIQSNVLDVFKNRPKSIILTGNAGDGKTRLCRIVNNQLSDNDLVDWPEGGIIEIEFEHGRLRIVKDLSELRDDVIFKQLKELQSSIVDDSSKLYFLIAANEGKLTKFLSSKTELNELKNMVNERFKSHKDNDDQFSVINLLDVTSSLYVEKILDHWSQNINWKECYQCRKRKACIIFLNHQRLKEIEIRRRVFEQYRLIEYMGVHITLREILIHLSFLITGGLRCEDIHKADYKELSEQSKKVYYENFYGNNADANAFTEMKAIKLFKTIDPGFISQSEIDDFIINGDISGDDTFEDYHKKLFNKELDMEFGFFRRKLNQYRDHNGIIEGDFIDEWIRKLRRKLYYEVSNDMKINRHKLLPFQHLSSYEKLFESDKAKQQTKNFIINGLNRSFTNRLVKPSKNLYATSQDLMIKDIFKNKQVEIIEQENRDDLDYLPSEFILRVDDKIKMPVNLFIFEYLMRVNYGGTHNALSEEANILIDTFKNELLEKSEPEEYVLNVLKLDKDIGLYVEDEINL